MPVLFAKTTASTIPEIEANPDVTAVNIDRQVQGPKPAADTDTNKRSLQTAATDQTVSWGVKRIGAHRVSDRLREDATRNVTVAVVDSGVDYTHPDLGEKVEWGADFTGTDAQYGRETATDANGHGTAVAGIIAAEDNDRGTVGIAPGARLYSIKVLDESNSGTISALIRGINAALEGPDGTIGTDDDADVIQVSAGTNVADEQLAAATAAASDSAVVVSSVGNSGDGDPATAEVTFPAKYEETIAVAATGTNDEATGYSAEGDTVDVAAPGNRIVTLSPETGTTPFIGTSAATPHVSGMVALLLAADDDSPGEDQTTRELRGLVGRTARDIGKPGPDRFSGDGLVQSDAAVAEVLPATVERTTSETSVAGGETVTVTQVAYAAESNLTVADSFEPSMSAAEIQSVTVNGKTVTPADTSANATGTAVSLHGLDIGDKVSVTYVVELPVAEPESERYRIESVGSDGNAGTGQTTLQVSARGPVPMDPSVYDRDNDQEIDAGELGIAGADFARGEITARELGVVGDAFARGRIRG